jgi:hypothetical protein
MLVSFADVARIWRACTCNLTGWNATLVS